MSHYKIFNNFKKGAIDELFSDRLDLPSVQQSLREAVNCYSDFSGVCKKRPGTLFLAEANTPGTEYVRIIPFSKGNGERYFFLLGLNQVEIWKVEDSLSITYKRRFSGAPWGYSKVALRELQYCVYNNKIYFFHRDTWPIYIDAENNSAGNWNMFTGVLDGPFGGPIDYKWTDPTATPPIVAAKVSFRWQHITPSADAQPLPGFNSYIVAIKAGTTSDTIYFFDKFVDLGRSIMFYNGQIDPTQSDFKTTIYDSKLYAAGIITEINPLNTEVKSNLVTNVTIKWTRPPFIGGWPKESSCKEAYIGVFGRIRDIIPGEYDRGKNCTPVGYPGCVGFHQQRMILGGTQKSPNTFWGSAVASWEIKHNNELIYTIDTDEVNHFWKYISVAVAPDDMSYSHIISSKLQAPIRWISQAQTLIIGTEESEYAISGSSNSTGDDSTTTSDPITPRSITINKETMFGSSNITPIYLNNFFLFVAKLPYRLVSFFYNATNKGFSGINYDLFNTTWFSPEKTIVEITKISSNSNYVMLIDSTGGLTVITITQDIEDSAKTTSGWFKYTTKESDEYLSCASLTKNNAMYSVVLFKRDGKYLIERFVENDYVADDLHVYCDSSKRYASDPPETEITHLTNLEHLNNKEVTILADGNVLSPMTVTNNELTLPIGAKKVTVGLAYEMKVTLHPLMAVLGESEGQATPVPGIKTQPIYASFKFLKSKVCSYGIDDKGYELSLREGMSKNTTSFTGYKKVTLPSRMTSNEKLWFSSKSPVALNIQGITIKVRN